MSNPTPSDAAGDLKLLSDDIRRRERRKRHSAPLWNALSFLIHGIVFAVIVFGFAAWYGTLAWRGFTGGATGAVAAADGVVEATPATFADALKSAKRPVLVDCWASWCKNCAAMDVVMSEKPVREVLKRYTVIKLQAEDIRELRMLPGFGAVQGLPAFGVIEGE